MNNNFDEIEGSQHGDAQAADYDATPYSLTTLSEIIGDIRLLVSQYCNRPTKNKDTKVMFVSSLSSMIRAVNEQLSLYIEDLKQCKIVEAFCISSGLYRDDEFWSWIDMICEEMSHEVYQFLKVNRDRLQSLLAEAESAMRDCNPIVFEKFFYAKKLDFSDARVMKRFNLYLYEHQPPSIDKLREIRAQTVAQALETGVFDFASAPSQKEMKEVSIELIKDCLPYGYEVTESFRIAYAKFRRFGVIDGLTMTLNYTRYGKYILHHFYDFSDAQRYAIFEFDMMLLLINQEMVKLEPDQEKHLNSTANDQPYSNQQEPAEELFHFIHPSLDDEEGWKIHNEVKRLVKRQSVPDICQYLRKLNLKDKILLPLMPSVAYAELTRMGMPNGEGFSEKYFRNCYMK